MPSEASNLQRPEPSGFPRFFAALGVTENARSRECVHGITTTTLTQSRFKSSRIQSPALPWLHRDFAELLLESLDQLHQRCTQSLGVRIAHDHAIGHLE